MALATFCLKRNKKAETNRGIPQFQKGILSVQDEQRKKQTLAFKFLKCRTSDMTMSFILNDKENRIIMPRGHKIRCWFIFWSCFWTRIWRINFWCFNPTIESCNVNMSEALWLILSAYSIKASILLPFPRELLRRSKDRCAVSSMMCLTKILPSDTN